MTDEKTKMKRFVALAVFCDAVVLPVAALQHMYNGPEWSCPLPRAVGTNAIWLQRASFAR